MSTRTPATRRLGLAAAVVVVAVAAGALGYATRDALRPEAPAASASPSLADSGLGRDFTLTDQRGRPASLSDFRGRVVLLFFGYTHCPDVCPTTLLTMREVKKGLGEDAKRFAGVFVTVDPERDTPERLRDYVAFYDPDFVGLTGTPEQIEEVARDFGAYFERGEPDGNGGYLMGHSSFGYLIDPEGRVETLLPFGTPAADIRDAVRRLLAAAE